MNIGRAKDRDGGQRQGLEALWRTWKQWWSCAPLSHYKPDPNYITQQALHSHRGAVVRSNKLIINGMGFTSQHRRLERARDCDSTTAKLWTISANWVSPLSLSPFGGVRLRWPRRSTATRDVATSKAITDGYEQSRSPLRGRKFTI